jgi:hypothetical protein
MVHHSRTWGEIFGVQKAPGGKLLVGKRWAWAFGVVVVLMVVAMVL